MFVMVMSGLSAASARASYLESPPHLRVADRFLLNGLKISYVLVFTPGVLGRHHSACQHREPEPCRAGEAQFLLTFAKTLSDACCS